MNLAFQPALRSTWCLVLILTAINVCGLRARANRPGDPWTDADLVEPSRLAGELAHANASSRPSVVYVGFRTLFAGGHISGATFHGTASANQGFVDLKKWAETLPRNTNLVIYCGCCPFHQCPNIRPAFILLHGMGFTHVRVLDLPTSFAVDWLEKGYPSEKGM